MIQQARNQFCDVEAQYTCKFYVEDEQLFFRCAEQRLFRDRLEAGGQLLVDLCAMNGKRIRLQENYVAGDQLVQHELHDFSF